MYSAAATQPVEIDLDRTRALTIVWADGARSSYPLAVLRRECPCAACREARREQGRNPLRVMQSAAEQREMVIAEGVELVGHYALRIFWKDGHATGIYDFELLRSLAAAAGEPESQSNV